jgi:hypothetical protein
MKAKLKRRESCAKSERDRRNRRHWKGNSHHGGTEELPRLPELPKSPELPKLGRKTYRGFTRINADWENKNL